MSTVYGFSDIDDFERTADVVRIVLRKLGITEFSASSLNESEQLYVRCDTVIDSEDTEIDKKSGTATQVEFDFTTHDWVTRGSDPMIFDYDKTASGGNADATFFNTSNIFSETTLVAETIYLVAPYYGSTSHQFGEFAGSTEDPTKSSWIVIETGGTSSVLLNLKSFDEETGFYTADILNPDDNTVKTADVLAGLLQGVTNSGILLGTPTISNLTKTVDGNKVYIIEAPIII